MPRIRPLESNNHVEGRGFARAVCAEQSNHLALLDVQTDIVDDATFAVCLLSWNAASAEAEGVSFARW